MAEAVATVVLIATDVSENNKMADNLGRLMAKKLFTFCRIPTTNAQERKILKN